MSIIKSMNFSPTVVQHLKPAAEWTDKEVAQAQYDLTALTGPQLTGNALSAFRFFCESPFLKDVLFSIYMHKNALPKVLTAISIPEPPKPTGVPGAPSRPEEGVVVLDHPECPAARLRAALSCLGIKVPSAHGRGARSQGGGKSLKVAANSRPGIMDYHSAYLTGDVTPSDVAESVIRFLEDEEGAANWLCDWKPEHFRAQAAASTARYAAGRAVSVLDGVPYAVKDAIDVFAHANGSGTSFLGEIRGPVPDIALEAPAVAALRSLGAILLGKTQMQEFGLLPTGISSKLGLARNPHHYGCIPGGSSGGSACVVASGACCFAIGTDGGGSVRIPAALCGVVGFKATQGRMASDPEGSSLVTLGPLTNSVGDALLVYAAMACPSACFKSPLSSAVSSRKSGGGYLVTCTSARDPNHLASETAEEAQAEVDKAAEAVRDAAAAPAPDANLGEAVAARPPLALPISVMPKGHGSGGDGEEGAAAGGEESSWPRGEALIDAKPLAGVKIGIFKPWFEDAEPCVVNACYDGVDLLKSLGAQLVDIVLPELDHIRVAHLVAFLSECYANNRRVVTQSDQRVQLHEDTRVILSVAGKLSSADYLQALRVRSRQTAHWRRAFQSCDFIVTPGTACVAPIIPDGAELQGLLDLTQCTKLVRFTQQANLLGLPAIVLPVGRNKCGACATGAPAAAHPSQLPVALQLIGQPWHDASLLRTACILEAALRASCVPAPLPPLMVNPLVKPEKPNKKARAGA